MLRVLFLGTGGAPSTRALRAVAAAHRVVGVVRAAPANDGPVGMWRALASRLHGRIRPDGYARLAAAARVPLHTLRGRDPDRLASLVRETRADIVCVVSFPWLLPRAVWSAAPLGAVNVHGSLLPRHRGVLPLFWIYYRDDRTTGVTVHAIDEGADTGPILAQEAFDLPRGLDVEVLNRWNADRGAGLLGTALAAVEAGSALRTPQDPAAATPAPRPGGGPMVDFDVWPAERVWHFLAGLRSRYREPLHDEAGSPVSYGGVAGWRPARHGLAPGTIRAIGGGFDVHCIDGIVHLSRTRSPAAR